MTRRAPGAGKWAGWVRPGGWWGAFPLCTKAPGTPLPEDLLGFPGEILEQPLGTKVLFGCKGLEILPPREWTKAALCSGQRWGGVSIK